LDEDTNERVGFIIIAGLKNPHESIELKRIVIEKKGQGLGRKALKIIKKLAFEELNAHRLWLYVKEFNHRARHLYKTEGFIEEGLLRDCLKTDQRYESLIVMSILKNEY
jgi:diamine N-acetyltransferase